MRFFNKRLLLALFGVIALLVLALAGSLYIYINSPEFAEQARRYIVREIERRTGGKASLKTFTWDLRHQRFRLDDLTLRGLEAPEEAPLAHFERIDIGLNFRTLLQRRIDLFELTLLRPDFHVMVGQDGKTNIPSPEPETEKKPFNFQISIQNFTITGGSALLNEHQVNIDFSLANLAGVLNYQAAREVLETHIRYDGVYDSSSATKSSIPYTLSADMDYTRATLVAHTIVVNSGKSQLTLHGLINDLLSRNISGKLEYAGTADVPFLNHFFKKERFAGKADLAGTLEFSRGYFFTHGTTASSAVDFEGWHATKLTGEYAYHYPERRLSLRNLKAAIIDGSVAGSVVVERLPGPSRVLLELDYAGIDSAELARAYPWDPKYRIFADMTGTLNGWFEGKLQRYDLSGHADFQSYTPSNAADLVPIPLDGSTDYEVIPGQARVANADVRFYSTSVKADGLIDGIASDLKVVMSSSDLKDLAFLYSDANGSGSFDGILSGRIAKPILNGEFTLNNHVYGKWTIQQAVGSVNLDTEAENAKFRDARVTQGESEILVNGTTALSGATSDLHVQSNRVIDRDLQPFLDRTVGGTFAGDLHVTSLSPILRLEGDVHASNLSIDHRLIGDARGHVRLLDPVVEVDGLSVRQNQSALSGDFVYNRVTSALKFSARATSVDVSLFRDLGLPESLTGFIRQAEFSGNGTTRQPNIQGNATVENLSFYGEAFPQTRINLSSAGSKLNVRLDTGRNATLNAQIDTAAAGYPFTAQATFARYNLERIGGLSEGTMIATGNANLSGILTDRTRLRGNGEIDSAEIRVQQTTLHTTKSFAFEFNSDRLTITGVTLAGEATQVNLAGTIGLVQRAPLNLDVSGRLDLALLSAAYPDWSSAGAVNVEGRIGGTVQDPDLRGLAHLANASLGRRGFFTSLSNLNGDLFFDQNRVTLNNVEGKVGGGVLRAQGNAVLQRRSIEAMNIRIEADAVRVRYPQGLRTIIGGSMVLRGTSTSPLLEGNLQIQSLAYRNSFEEFLALVTERSTSNVPSSLSRLRLAMHVEGSRNITIQNQLADLEARIDVDIKGTAADPSLTGHIEASGGTLLFQGNRYRITRGNIDFVDPVRVEPVVDVQAESEVRDYRVILTITGRGKQLHLELRSDPPLPELEIVSLIAGGRTREEYAARRDPAVPTSEQLFQGGAASILFDLLQQRVGNRLGLLGLDRVRVNPLIVGRANNPGARITLSEQVTPNLSITYAQDVSSNQEQVIVIEYFVDRNTSIVASRDELGYLGLDLRKRKRF